MYKKIPKVPALLPTQQTGSNFGTKQREKSGMGLEMVAERPRALKNMMQDVQKISSFFGLV